MKNCLATSLLFSFFFENAKNLGRSDDAKRRKKKGWPKSKNYTLASHERDHKDLVQIWLIKNPDLSGESRISTAFKLSLTNQQPDLLRKTGTSRQLDPSRGYKS